MHGISAKQAFAIVAIIIFLGSYLFMINRSIPNQKTNINTSEETVYLVVNATFSSYMPYLYLSPGFSNDNVSHLKPSIEKYIDYIDEDSGIISLKSSEYLPYVYEKLENNNIGVLAGIEFRMHANGITSDGKNISTGSPVIEIQAKPIYREGDIITTGMQAITVNGALYRYSQPSILTKKTTLNGNIQIVNITGVKLIYNINWEDQWKLKSIVEGTTENTSYNVTIDAKPFIVVNRSLTPLESKKLSDIEYVSYVGEQMIILDKDALYSVNDANLYTEVNRIKEEVEQVIGKGSATYPDAKVIALLKNTSSIDIANKELNAMLRGVGIENNAKPGIEYVYLAYVYDRISKDAQIQDHTQSLGIYTNYTSSGKYDLGDVINVSITGYVTGNKLVSVEMIE